MNPSFSLGAPTADAADRFQPYKTVIAIGLIAAAIYAWWPHRAFAPTNTIKSKPFISGQFAADTEAAWLARQIGRDILEVVAYASTRKHPGSVDLHFESGTTFDSKKHLFTGRFDGIAEKKVTVSVVDYFWSPESFAPWASSLLNAVNAGSPEPASQFNAELLSTLTNPTAETFMREDKRLSEALTENPLDPELHEEAALLIGSFAMRETASAWLCDRRRYLCRMTAHLALAKASRENLGNCGRLAEAILCSLTGRETPALQLTEQVEKNIGSTDAASSNAIGIWSRALRLRNTTDYRQLQEPEKASLLERLEYVRALRMSAGATAASKFVTDHEVEKLPEWGAQILLGDISVEDGNTWALDTLRLELEAIATHYRDYFGKPLERNELTNSLNVEWEQFPKSDGARLQVLGWGAWAEQHQRQLSQLIHNVSCWLGQLLGLPKDAADFETKMTEQFGSLRLFPSIPFYTHGDDGTKAWIEQVRKFVGEHREWITYYQWSKVWEENLQLFPPVAMNRNPPNGRHQKMRPQALEQQRGATKPDPLLATGNWFFERLLPGTLFDLSNRGGRDALLVSTLDIEALKAMAPSNSAVIYSHLMRTTNFKPTPEQTDAAFSVLSGYDVGAMKLVANAFYADPARYAEKFAALCWFDPNRYVDLGNYLLEHGDENGAVQAFQNAFDHAIDRVHVSNTMDWLVNYYFEHGKTEEAYKIASEGAEVYSQVGLVAFANLLDRMGKVDEAESYLKKAEQRYPDSTKDDLVDFYARHRGKSPSYADEEKKFRALIFPDGVEQVTLSDLHGQPKDGMALVKSSPRTEKAGLRSSDVIVAVNGCRVHNIYQYYAARAPSTNPNVKFIVWRAGNYMEMDSFFPKRPDFSRLNLYKPHPGDH